MILSQDAGYHRLVARLRLILMRHGESGWDGDPPSDHDRVLTERGRLQAASSARQIVAHGWVPERVITSTASRATETAGIVADTLEGVACEQAQAIYSGGLGVLQDIIGALDACQVVMVVGHNPTFSSAASTLSSDDVRLSTGNAALLELEAPSWEEAMSARDWRLVDVVRPSA